MTAVLLANAAATFFMTGISWFIQSVHYPAFPQVGAEGFAEFHQRHSSRTTLVVLPPMVVELLTSFALVIDPPGGKYWLAAAGACLAVLTWLLTAAGAAPIHRKIGERGLSDALHRRLLAVSWGRTVAWTAHAGIVVAMLSLA